MMSHNKSLWNLKFSIIEVSSQNPSAKNHSRILIFCRVGFYFLIPIERPNPSKVKLLVVAPEYIIYSTYLWIKSNESNQDCKRYKQEFDDSNRIKRKMHAKKRNDTNKLRMEIMTLQNLTEMHVFEVVPIHLLGPILTFFTFIFHSYIFTPEVNKPRILFHVK